MEDESDDAEDWANSVYAQQYPDTDYLLLYFDRRSLNADVVATASFQKPVWMERGRSATGLYFLDYGLPFLWHGQEFTSREICTADCAACGRTASNVDRILDDHPYALGNIALTCPECQMRGNITAYGRGKHYLELLIQAARIAVNFGDNPTNLIEAIQELDNDNNFAAEIAELENGIRDWRDNLPSEAELEGSGSDSDN